MFNILLKIDERILMDGIDSKLMNSPHEDEDIFFVHGESGLT